MSEVRTPVRRRVRVAAAAMLAGLALVVAPVFAGAAQADDPPTPLYLFTTWRLYDYQINRSPLFGQTNTIQVDATNLAVQYSHCTSTCFYLIPTLPYGATGTRVFFAKIGWRGVVGDPEGLAVAQALEVNAGPSLLNSYYNYGSVGTVTRGDIVYAAFIMTHYAVDPPQ